MQETGLELNISDSGKRLGLKDLSAKIVDLILAAPCGMPEPNDADYQTTLVNKVEKLIVDYFTS